MVALMLDACFKGMDCIMDYIGRDQVAILLQQYDALVESCNGIFESKSSCKLDSSITPTTFDFNYVV